MRYWNFTETKLILQHEREESELVPELFLPVTQESWKSDFSKPVFSRLKNRKCYSCQFCLNLKSALTWNDSLYFMVLRDMWEAIGIREGRGSCEREEYLCYRAHHVSITIIPFTWLNSWGSYERMDGLNSFSLFHLKNTTNSSYLFLIYHRAITEWNYLSAVIIHGDHHFKETLS